MKVEIRNLTKQFGDMVAVDDVSFTVEDGEFVTLVGPSGCGKTTTLRCIAGLERPTSGRILFGGEDVTEQTPQERDIAFVFQDYALYPHMTVRRNMTFALEDAGLSSDEIRRKVEDTAEMLGIEEQLEKKPSSLSGGQQQRVALGRSIVRDPDIFLLDEPLANLDAKLRVQMRTELQELHQRLDTTTVYVTHDQEEAMTMSDRIAILNDGELQQISSPAEAYTRPRNEFVGNFIGSPSMNLLPCNHSNGLLSTATFTLEAPDEMDEGASIATLGIRPEDVRLVDIGTGHVDATVQVFEQVGAFNIVYLDIDGVDGEFVTQVPRSQQLSPGRTVGVSLDGKQLHVFDTDGSAAYNPKLYTEAPTEGIQ
ncbi:MULTISPECIES: ABC transporter ATP-binding protein [unclassified Haladaptatus]|uniref:ABC transporter ATP-binding protein n=1 Tax=unclassified Haladaptatus TaxID=2622732 RepID=UPI00209C6654|nr:MULTISPECIES: ABC transporter ATP-binding protein [unclassified Haladaptatus]MCO8243569.1 ABC transporter ATP-binding protein [Haladaptatus sp. AB643]MCO8254978.1 ABC transporter ATP-binding protein [Haladaptatus sp. AB618]